MAWLAIKKKLKRSYVNLPEDSCCNCALLGVLVMLNTFGVDGETYKRTHVQICNFSCSCRFVVCIGLSYYKVLFVSLNILSCTDTGARPSAYDLS